jgi:hypothetical protein
MTASAWQAFAVILSAAKDLSAVKNEWGFGPSLRQKNENDVR